MDWLGDFAFRTGFPFGYLIAAVGGLVLGAVGFALLIRGLDARLVDPVRVTAGGIVVAWLGCSVAANVVYAGALEMNPMVTETGVIGEWRMGGARLWLRPDGTYRCEGHGPCDVLGAGGRWRLEGFLELVFERPDGPSSTKRLVGYWGVLRLTDPIEDPDGCDGRLTFAHVDPPGR